MLGTLRPSAFEDWLAANCERCRIALMGRAYFLDIARNWAHGNRSLQGAHRPKQKSCRYFPPRQNWAARRRPILGDLNVSLVCSACGRAGPACGCNRRYGFAAMRAVDNAGLLGGPANPKCIDIRSPAEMRHWAREIGQPAAKLNEAVRAVGPLVSNVRDYLRKHSLYGRRR